MKKEETIRRYGQDAYDKLLAGNKVWTKENSNLRKANGKAWRRKNAILIQKYRRDRDSKGGKYYTKRRIYDTTGLRGERNRIRKQDGNKWKLYKKIIAPDSQLHHQWCPKTAEYTGIALVEADKHMHGVIDVIKILKGSITLFTEREIREQETKNIKG